ncbi:hypothetical protein [Neptuniibacter sp. QD37_11]|uniref:hypothetical protein n=1 Tax=Neptuniibacter sp. QD37_11 TaxID=3398209 RepID=UPI0039F622B2
MPEQSKFQVGDSIKQCSTDQLKRLWDEWDKYMDDECNSPLPFHYEDIHLELNLRGEGEHCAV